MIFAEPLEPLTRRQRNLVIAIAVIVALTRLLALSKTLWDWDEALFTLGVGDYDVPSHRPHPPGYPLFILAAKIVQVIVRDDFRAVQSVVLLASLALFPALFALARELRFPFAVAAAGAALCAFFPNVWYYGGTALSDIPSLVLVCFAAALLLRGCRERRAYVLGALMLGVAAGVRPQNLLIGLAPALVATWCRRRAWRDVAAAAAVGAAVVAASYAGAALASSSWRDYLGICAIQSRYIREVDSYLNPGRPPLASLASAIFIHPMHAGRFDRLLAALAAIGLLLGLRRGGLLVAMFLPIQLFTWLMLDMSNFSRYSIAFIPMYALLIANAFVWMRAWSALPVVAIVARLVWWTLPALNEVRRTESPSAAAMKSVRASKTIYVHGGVAAFANVFLPGRNVTVVDKDEELPMTAAPYVREGATIAPGARLFSRNRKSRLATFVRQHYFEVTVMRAADAAVFRDGWYGEENDGAAAWRWMSGRATMLLPPAGARARLSMHFHVPEDVKPALTLQLNGRLVDRFVCAAGEVEKSWDVDARPGAPNELVLSIDHVAKPPGDPRQLGLQLFSYTWGPR